MSPRELSNSRIVSTGRKINSIKNPKNTIFLKQRETVRKCNKRLKLDAILNQELKKRTCIIDG